MGISIPYYFQYYYTTTADPTNPYQYPVNTGDASFNGAPAYLYVQLPCLSCTPELTLSGLVHSRASSTCCWPLCAPAHCSPLACACT